MSAFNCNFLSKIYFLEVGINYQFGVISDLDIRPTSKK